MIIRRWAERKKGGRMLVELFFIQRAKMYVVICLFLRVSTLDHVERGKGNEMKCCYMLPTGPRMSRL